MKNILFTNLTLIAFTVTLAASGCSSKTARHPGDSSSWTAEVPTVATPNTAENTVKNITDKDTPAATKPTQDPKTIPGHFVAYTREEIESRGGVVNMTKRSEYGTAKFSGEVFDPAAKPETYATIERKTLFSDTTLVESTETIRIESVELEYASGKVKVWTQMGDRKFESERENKCVRAHDRTMGYYITCGMEEVREYPLFMNAKEIDSTGKGTVLSARAAAKELSALQNKRAACEFASNSDVPLISTEYGVYVITLGSLAEDSVREERNYQGTVTCIEGGKPKSYPAARKFVSIRSYTLPSLYRPMVGTGMIVYSSDEIETYRDTVFSTKHQVVDFK